MFPQVTALHHDFAEALHKDGTYPSALSATKPSHILRSSIPTRTSMDDPITLTGTDPVTGWTMLRTIRNNAFIHIHGGLEWITKHAPIPVTGVDFDNGSEFMNWAVITWCDKQAIPVTRSRPYKHNDNAHVEQRNGDWVRRHAFRYRYETDAELALLNELWDLVMARKNHLLPCVKATGWDTTPAGRKKRTYDKPRTPYQRLIDTGTLDEQTHTRLQAEHAALNPAKLTRAITHIQTQLIDLAAARTRGTRPAA
ncbi:MAG: hypothetical protein WBC31_07825 [Candidatus Phosphoribacter baldrii]